MRKNTNAPPPKKTRKTPAQIIAQADRETIRDIIEPALEKIRTQRLKKLGRSWAIV